ncbi:integrase [Friedmanniella endophytica]|uniref:Integrase n=1 Tax=Microlunatus kandeliicorticis TaxID=1759536 RepID=A0A7W3ITF3_9ACTN|nr:site-specific integrase [Microlunatus kandeliicorticis]MBA8794933.1 integrase [Microlunatus kandeliicorticis]
MGTRRSFGQLRRLPSKRWQAGYTAQGRVHHASSTFKAKIDAEAWLTDERRLLESGMWTPPSDRVAGSKAAPTVAAYSEPWLADRTLKPRTRQHYRQLLDRQILPALGERPLRSLTPLTIRQWHADLGSATPTLRAHAYALLRTILGSAVQDGLIPSNPAHIRGAGNAKRVHRIEPATLEQIAAIAGAMPPRYRLMVLFAAWCGLRFGELAELRRFDLDLENQRIRVRRAVVRVDGQTIVGTPKSDAGIRDVAYPDHLEPVIRAHLTEHTAAGHDALLFPAADGVNHMATSTLYKVFYRARAAAGRPDLRWHDLRHTGATMAAMTGATMAELMARLGHSTQGAALRYQHAAADRDLEIARRLSAMARGV